MRSQLPAIAVILTAASGCDNVAWGGVEFSVESPRQTMTVDSSAAATPESVPVRPTGPILLAGRRDGRSIRLEPVGELIGDDLVPLPEAEDTAAHRSILDERLATGTEWTLFSAGVRVGSATAFETVDDLQLCGVSPVLVATPELLPAATEAQRFLALPSDYADDWTYEDYRPLDHNYDQRVASLSLGAAALPRVGAPWPEGGMLPNRRDVQAFRVRGDPGPSVAASFVVGDALDTSPASNESYALFMIADERIDGFEESFVWYRPASSGKAAPSFFDHLDWDGDGQDELLIEVFGEGSRGYLALQREGDPRPARWTEAFHSPCPQLGPPADTSRN